MPRRRSASCRNTPSAARFDLLRGFLSRSRWFAVGSATVIAAAGIVTVRLLEPHLAGYLVLPLSIAFATLPVDHPHGGGEGRTSGGRHPVSPWGQPTKGYKTRTNKRTDSLIIRRRNKGK